MSTLIPLAVLVGHIIFAFILLALIFRKSWGESVIAHLRKFAVQYSLLVSASAVVGSLIYSNLIGYAPCVLCWWQRIFLYPQAIMFAAAARKSRLSVFIYSLPLTILGGIVALYHAYSNAFGGSILPCTAVGGECSKVFVNAYGYITIPVMALTAFAYLFLLALISRTHEDSHS